MALSSTAEYHPFLDKTAKAKCLTGICVGGFRKDGHQDDL